MLPQRWVSQDYGATDLRAFRFQTVTGSPFKVLSNLSQLCFVGDLNQVNVVFEVVLVEENERTDVLLAYGAILRTLR